MGFYVMIEGRPGGRAVRLGGDYRNAEHARRDCILQRIARPRAYAVAAYGPGGLLMRLHRREGVNVM